MITIRHEVWNFQAFVPYDDRKAGNSKHFYCGPPQVVMIQQEVWKFEPTIGQQEGSRLQGLLAFVLNDIRKHGNSKPSS